VPTPVTVPALVPPGPPLTSAQLERYSRHLLLPEIGMEGQRRLRNARVVVVGAGGLGAPVLQYLAAAGVGVLGVVDDDVVDVTNLQRQVIHGAADVGRSKAESARDAVQAIDPDVRVVLHTMRLDEDNAEEILGQYDVVVDGTDNFPTRYLVNDACVRLRLPHVWGSVLRFDAQTTVFWGRPPAGVPAVQLRDLFPTPPGDGEVPSCAEAGVLGALCGQVGSVMATEVVKLVTGTGEPMIGRVLVVDALRGRWSQVPLAARPAPEPEGPVLPPRPLDGTVMFGGADEVPLGVPRLGASAPDQPVKPRINRVEAPGAGRFRAPGKSSAQDVIPTMSVDELAAALEAGEDLLLLDVREPAEAAVAAIPGSRLVPLARVLDGSALADLPKGTRIAVHCQSGGRSAVATQVLLDKGFNAVNVSGGMAAWQARTR